MVLNTRTYAKIGRQVVERHPEIAHAIIKAMPQPKEKDLSRILDLIELYSVWSGVAQESLLGAIHRPSLTEQRKVFISAMIRLYAEPHLFQKRIKQVLQMHHSAVSEIVAEVKVRYAKDITFCGKVDSFLKSIILQNNQYELTGSAGPACNGRDQDN